MSLNFTTPVPNSILDNLMKDLNGSELKLLLAINRNTLGWVDKKTKKRKSRDWISHRQFTKMTGLSERSITEAVKNLLEKKLIAVTSEFGEPLEFANDRKFASRIFYSITLENSVLPEKTSINKQNLPKNPMEKDRITPNNFLSTKETQKKFSRPQFQKLSDKERYDQIVYRQQQMQEKRDNWI